MSWVFWGPFPLEFSDTCVVISHPFLGVSGPHDFALSVSPYVHEVLKFFLAFSVLVFCPCSILHPRNFLISLIRTGALSLWRCMDPG